MKIPARTLVLVSLLASIPFARAADSKPAATAAAETRQAAPAATKDYLAVVNGKTISSAEFETNFREAARQKFYHGSPPEAEIEALGREVAYNLIDRILLLAEAKRRGLKPVAADVDAKISNYENRYASSPRWQQERGQILPGLRARLEEDSLLAVLEAEARKVPEPPTDKVMAYYKKNPDKFTEPEKIRISLLLLNVDPSSPEETWQAAATQAGVLRLQLTEGGADFAELARKNSNHESADAGGNLGYLHKGMLPDGIQEKIDSLKVGELSQPTRVLQGVALFRYDDYQPAKHHPFEKVSPRAKDLLMRDLQNQAWEDFRQKLRTQAKLDINTQRYPMMAAQAGKDGK